MELRQLRYFTCLCEERSMTRAAQRLNIVQPALSMQITKLEEEFGQVLFERTSRGMRPTEAGEQAYRLFVPILRDLFNARQTMINRAGEITGRISAGLIASANQNALAPVLAYFAENYPEVEISVTNGYSDELIEKVQSATLDFVVINQSMPLETLSSDAIVAEELLLVTGAANRLAIPAPIRFSDLEALKLVLPSKRHGLRGVIDRATAAQGGELKPALEIDDLATIEAFVRRSDWLTLLPAITIHRGLQQGELRAYSLVPPGMVRHITCVHDTQRPLTPAARLFVDLLTKNMLAAVEAIDFYKEG